MKLIVMCWVVALLPAAAASAPAPAASSATGQSPAAACYRAARDGGSDAYTCDLAVQMARDPGAGAVSGSDAPGLAAALNNRGLVLSNDGRFEPALADFDAALTLRPEDPQLHGNRGNLLLRMGRLVDALNAHDRAVELAPEDPTGYYNRAFGHLALGERDAAERDLATARQLLEPPPAGAAWAAPAPGRDDFADVSPPATRAAAAVPAR